MDWQAEAHPQDQIALAQSLVEVTMRRGWSRGALVEASQTVFGDPDRWRSLFPRGARDAIWFISRISDASMLAAFQVQPAADMANVIEARFAQNHDLKPFVFRVMLFDSLHPIQALARMQRTARVMMACLPAGLKRLDRLSLSRLNIVYTALVFIWLFDDAPMDRQTGKSTRWAVRWLL